MKMKAIPNYKIQKSKEKMKDRMVRYARDRRKVAPEILVLVKYHLKVIPEIPERQFFYEKIG